MKISSLIVLLLTLNALSACSTLGVEPWERDTLARDDMQLLTDPVEAGLDDHIYFSKEATSGGRGFGGGGCGCN
tara:strand:- start:244 stop:465 length:222 start_codon:yes stop_codon:yes gene_type:complete